MKSFVFVISIVFISLSLSACSSFSYSDAIKAYENEDYETAITLFQELGDYKDSQEKVIDSIEEYVDDFIINKEWDMALSIIEKYCESYDISYLYDKVTFVHGKFNVENGVLKQGFEMLSNVSEQSQYYELAQNMINTYNELINSPLVNQLLGTWECNTDEMGLQWKHTLTFSLKYDSVVVDHLCRQNDLLTSDTYLLDVDDFSGNSAVSGSKKWVLSSDGKTLQYYTRYSSYTFKRR